MCMTEVLKEIVDHVYLQFHEDSGKVDTSLEIVTKHYDWVKDIAQDEYSSQRVLIGQNVPDTCYLWFPFSFDYFVQSVNDLK